MAVTPTFPSRDSLRRLRFRPLDAVVGAGVFLLIYVVVRVGAGAHVPMAGDFLVAVVTPVPAAPGPDELLAGYAALASQLGGQFTVLHGSPAGALAKFAHQQQVTEMVVARDPGASRHRVLNELTHRAGHAEVHVLPAPAR